MKDEYGDENCIEEEEVDLEYSDGLDSDSDDELERAEGNDDEDDDLANELLEGISKTNQFDAGAIG
jgi:hypothetical protein